MIGGHGYWGTVAEVVPVVALADAVLFRASAVDLVSAPRWFLRFTSWLWGLTLIALLCSEYHALLSIDRGDRSRFWVGLSLGAILFGLTPLIANPAIELLVRGNSKLVARLLFLRDRTVVRRYYRSRRANIDRLERELDEYEQTLGELDRDLAQDMDLLADLADGSPKWFQVRDMVMRLRERHREATRSLEERRAANASARERLEEEVQELATRVREAEQRFSAELLTEPGIPPTTLTMPTPSRSSEDRERQGQEGS